MVIYIPSHDQTFVVSVLQFKLMAMNISSQCSYLVPPSNLWFSFAYRGYNIGKLAIEGLILNEILNIRRSQCSHFIPPQNTRKLEVFWCFQVI